MEATLKKELGAEVVLIKGRSGIFDVAADGKPVFSKHAAGRVPEENEVVEAIRALK